MVLVAFCLFAISGLLLYIGLKPLFTATKKDKEDFYKEVVSKIGEPDFSRQRVYERVAEIGKKYKIKSEDCKDAFKIGKEIALQEKEKQKAAEKKEKKEFYAPFEKNRYNYNIKYRNCTPVQKRINMLEDEEDKILNRQKAQNNAFIAAAAFGNAFDEEENDSALLGGIAAGIAGNAYGSSVYLINELENQEIRKNNKERKDAYIKSLGDTFNSIVKSKFDDETKIEFIENAISEAEKKESRTDITNLMDEIFVDSIELDPTPSGACDIHFCASSIREMKIGNKTAVIDGFIKATLLKDDTAIDTTIIPLPLFGLGEAIDRLDGVFINCDVSYEDNLTAELEADRLWLIEE